MEHVSNLREDREGEMSMKLGDNRTHSTPNVSTEDKMGMSRMACVTMPPIAAVGALSPYPHLYPLIPYQSTNASLIKAVHPSLPSLAASAVT